jgi:hypothetical protein
MASYNSKILEYCKANGVSKVNFPFDVELTDKNNDGNIVITQWNLDIPQPTSEEIDSYETVANETEANTPSITDLRNSAKAKLIAGEALTQEEADTIVL